MNEDEIISGEELGPMGLATIKGFGRHERLEVLVIREYLNWMMGSLEIMTPMAHAFDNG